jgi:hypothetical protein
MYEDVDVRPDLAAAHDRVWQGVSGPGDWLSGSERRAAALVTLAAFTDRDPSPPWASVADRFAGLDLAPQVIDAVFRMTAHAHTLSERWHRSAIDGLMGSGLSLPDAECAYVELCGVVSSVSAVASLARTLGSVLPPLPASRPGSPRRPVVVLAPSPRNWVPVASPGGARAPVVEALSIAPAEFALLWDHLAPAQYIADEEMIDLAWTRGTLSRPQIELVAGRVAALRQCFF